MDIDDNVGQAQDEDREPREAGVLLRGVVRYDGSNFSGWQIQPHVRTVQGELQARLAQVARRPVKVYGASRTDAGVHALGQAISFRWDASDDPERLRHSLSMMLGPEIRVDSLVVAPDDFHPRFDARGKRYGYTLDLQREPDPFSVRYAWPFRWAFDAELLETLLARLVGNHDFAGFQSSGADVSHTIRTIHSIRVVPGAVIGPKDNPHLMHLEFHGDGFLYKMIRNITGTVMHIARGKVPETALAERLASPGPYRGYTAPARGLTLMQVEYEEMEKAP